MYGVLAYKICNLHSAIMHLSYQAIYSTMLSNVMTTSDYQNHQNNWIPFYRMKLQDENILFFLFQTTPSLCTEKMS